MPAPSVRGFASAASAALLERPMNVWCVGRNYAEHIKELGNQQDLAPGAAPQPPMIFLKAGSSILHSGQPLILPRWSSDVHHEVELAVQVGADLEPVRAAVALDMTLRDVQAKLKKAQHPWTLGKSFKCSAPLGSWFPLTAGGGGKGAVDLQDVQLHLTVNGKVRQHDSTSKMLFKIDMLLGYIKDRFPVVPGDVVLTGTPHGVSALVPGDVVVAQVLSSKGEVLSKGEWHAEREAASS